MYNNYRFMIVPDKTLGLFCRPLISFGLGEVAAELGGSGSEE